jgi:peptidoglycan/xylan/chitin deacetylase (PgdA/CDA1 family)
MTSKKRGWGPYLGALALFLFGTLALSLPTLRLPSVPADAGAPLEEPAPSPKLIALTFDDGPRRSTTTALLDGLAQRGVKATFFLIGSQLENNEDLVCRMEQEGHQIGIHTFDHKKLTDLSRTDFDRQVDRTRQRLKEILGHNDFLLRPPYGMTDARVKAWAGCPIILWSIDPEDWGDQNTAREVSLIVKEAQDGSIILLHDIFPASVEAALQVVDQLHQEGYLFVTIDQLFAARNIPLETGEVYWNAYP